MPDGGSVATDIVMPQLGESIAEGTVVKWLIGLGGAVERDQPLLEVETDKVALEIPSPATGVLTEILVPEGKIVPVGTLPRSWMPSRRLVWSIVWEASWCDGMEAASESERPFRPRFGSWQENRV